MIVSSSISSCDYEKRRPVPSFLADTTMARIVERGVLRVAVESDAPGFAQLDPSTGRRVGLEIDVSRHLAHALFGGTVAGVSKRLEFIDVTPASRLAICESGAADVVIAMLGVNDVRRKRIDFTEPYFGSHLGVMARAGDEVPLDRARVAVVRGTTGEDWVRANGIGVSTVAVEHNLELAEMVAGEHVDAAIAGTALIEARLRCSPLSLCRTKDVFAFEPWAVGLALGQPQFKALLDQTLRQIVDEGILIGAAGSILR